NKLNRPLDGFRRRLVHDSCHVASLEKRGRMPGNGGILVQRFILNGGGAGHNYWGIVQLSSDSSSRAYSAEALGEIDCEVVSHRLRSLFKCESPICGHTSVTPFTSFRFALLLPNCKWV